MRTFSSWKVWLEETLGRFSRLPLQIRQQVVWKAAILAALLSHRLNYGFSNTNDQSLILFGKHHVHKRKISSGQLRLGFLHSHNLRGLSYQRSSEWICKNPNVVKILKIKLIFGNCNMILCSNFWLLQFLCQSLFRTPLKAMECLLLTQWVSEEAQRACPHCN